MLMLYRIQYVSYSSFAVLKTVSLEELSHNLLLMDCDIHFIMVRSCSEFIVYCSFHVPPSRNSCSSSDFSIVWWLWKHETISYYVRL